MPTPNVALLALLFLASASPKFLAASAADRPEPWSEHAPPGLNLPCKSGTTYGPQAPLPEDLTALQSPEQASSPYATKINSCGGGGAGEAERLAHAHACKVNRPTSGAELPPAPLNLHPSDEERTHDVRPAAGEERQGASLSFPRKSMAGARDTRAEQGLLGPSARGPGELSPVPSGEGGDCLAQRLQWEPTPPVDLSGGSEGVCAAGEDVGNPVFPPAQGPVPPPPDMRLLKMLASVQSTAYCKVERMKRWDCTRCQEQAVSSFEIAEVIFDEDWDLLAHVGYHPELDSVVVTFRGTDSHDIGNWVDDIEAWHAELPLPFKHAEGALVHGGFYNAFYESAIQPNVTSAVLAVMDKHPGTPIHVLGHSLGGALASIFALDFTHHLEKIGLLARGDTFTELHVTTFGSPRVGNAKFAELFELKIPNSMRVTHARDIIPSLPFRALGYHHVAREIWEVEVENAAGEVNMVLKVCDGSGEDWSCHRGQCTLLSPCLSTADHVMYLGIPMFHSWAPGTLLRLYDWIPRE